MQNAADSLENNLSLSYNAKPLLITLSSNPTLCIYLRDMTCIQMLIMALFIITQNWKQSKQTSTMSK